jgi:FAD/FMN-containing dehydrogenase
VPHPTAVDDLVTELTGLLGAEGVSTADDALDKASADGSYLSPVIKEQLPLGRADVVAFPADAAAIAATIGAAVRHGVPITPRGKGTGNYGQAIPMAGGLVLDMSRARTVVDVSPGALTADAGATFVELERAADATGQQILMYPSTARSSLGGFLSGGSGGTGSIRHGVLHRDSAFVRALDVVHAVPDAALVHVEGDDAQLYLHNYGTAGIIARATIALEPRQDWHGLFASFERFEQALSVIRPFAELEPTPRLVSADPVTLSEALPNDAGIPAGRCSLRAIVDAPALDAARALVEAAGGRVEDVRPGLGTTLRISMMSYNHPIEWLQKAYPDTYFHVEVQGDALVDRFAELVEVYPGGMLHIEAHDVRAGFARLNAIGVAHHDCHQWFVDYEPARTRQLASTTDPAGLLNPGKLPPA